jgi:hypothetical protein
MNLNTVAMAASLLPAALFSITVLPGVSRPERVSRLAWPPRDVRVVNGENEAVPVAVAGLPPVAIEGVAQVQVGNADTSPVPVRNVDHPAYAPWQQSFDLGLAEGETSKQLSLEIPSGQRLVLEHVSAGMTVMPDQTPVLQFWGGNPSASSVVHTIHIENVGPWGTSIQSRWSASHAMKVYLDSGLVRLSRAGGTAGPLFATVALSGTLVDVP